MEILAYFTQPRCTSPSVPRLKVVTALYEVVTALFESWKPFSKHIATESCVNPAWMTSWSMAELTEWRDSSWAMDLKDKRLLLHNVDMKKTNGAADQNMVWPSKAWATLPANTVSKSSKLPKFKKSETKNCHELCDFVISWPGGGDAHVDAVQSVGQHCHRRLYLLSIQCRKINMI